MALRFPLRYINESPAVLPPRQPQRRRWTPRSLWESVTFALAGLRYAFRTQRNLRIQCSIGCGALITALALKLPVHEVALVFALTALVLFAELLNTALEHMLDTHLGSAFDPSVKRIKDMTAASVLIASIGAGALGATLFLPRITPVALRLARSTPFLLLGTAALLPPVVLWAYTQRRQSPVRGAARLTTGILLTCAVALFVLLGRIVQH